jgi:hypothetical protein
MVATLLDNSCCYSLLKLIVLQLPMLQLHATGLVLQLAATPMLQLHATRLVLQLAATPMCNSMLQDLCWKFYAATQRVDSKFSPRSS